MVVLLYSKLQFYFSFKLQFTSADYWLGEGVLRFKKVCRCEYYRTVLLLLSRDPDSN